MARFLVWYLKKGSSESREVDAKDYRTGFFDSLHNLTLVVQFKKPDGSWGPIAGRFLREVPISQMKSKRRKKRS
jgi:hypothetical protein